MIRTLGVRSSGARSARTVPERGLAFAGIALATTIGIAALGSTVGAPPLPEPLALLDQRLPGIFSVHMAASGLGLILLPLILLFRRRPSLHRALGRVGAVLLLVGAATSLPSALQSESVPLARLGFFTQGLLCLVFLIGGVWAIRARNAGRHALMMMRVGALVSGAIVFRVLLAAAMSLGWPFDPTYATLAWLSWALPLALVLVWQMPRPRPAIRA